MAATNKDTIYVDIDDEITSIIDKVNGAQAPIVALVLPKRATMLQSSVNMKLLKKASDSAKKRVVLITSEAGLLPLASSIGLYVARTLQTKPEIPAALSSNIEPEIEDIVADSGEPMKDDFDTKKAADQPVGELAADKKDASEPPQPPKKAKPELTPIPIPRATDTSEDEAIELDNEEGTDESEAVPLEDEPKTKKKSKDKGPKVPNFERFRLRLILTALLLIILIVGFVIANSILPKATVDIATKTSGISINPTLNLSPGAKALDLTQMTLPATVQSTQKTSSQQVNTTGQQNNGNVATGSVTMTTQECGPSFSPPPPVPSGVGVSSGGHTYITQQSTSFSKFGTPDNTNPNCIDFSANNSTNITAQNGGSAFNGTINNASVSGYSNVTANGSASGGVDLLGTGFLS